MTIKGDLQGMAISAGATKEMADKIADSFLDWLACADVISRLERETDQAYSAIAYSDGVTVLQQVCGGPSR